MGLKDSFLVRINARAKELWMAGRHPRVLLITVEACERLRKEIHQTPEQIGLMMIHSDVGVLEVCIVDTVEQFEVF